MFFEGVVEVNVFDLYEGWNCKVFWFNEILDWWFLKLVVKIYCKVMLSVVDCGIINFFNNFLEICNFVNSIL